MPRLTAPTARPTTFRIEERTPLWWLRWVPAALLVVVILYLVYIVGRVAIIPVLASFGIAYVLNPIVEAFQKRGFSRALASLTALVIVAAAIVLFFVVCHPGPVGGIRQSHGRRYEQPERGERTGSSAPHSGNLSDARSPDWVSCVSVSAQSE